MLVGNKNDTFNIQLVNENNQLVDLQGQNWSFSIVFYVRSDTQELIREDLKIKTLEKIYKNQQKSIEEIFNEKLTK